MDSLLFSAPFSKGAFGGFWTGFVDSVRTGVSFVAKLWCRLRYVLFTPEFLVDKSPKMWHNTRRGCALRAVQCTVPPSYFACVAQLVEQLTRNEQVAGSSPATSSKRRHLSKYRCLLFIFSFGCNLCSKKPPATGRGLLICVRLRLALLAHQSSDNRSTLLFSHTVRTSFCTAIKRGPCKSSASQVS